MAKRIKSSKSKHSESFFVIDDYYNPETKKKTTFVVERLGNLASLMEKYGTDSRDEVVANLKDYVESLRKKDREDKAVVELSLSPDHLISRDSKRVFNIGYLYIRNILCSLGIRDICRTIASERKFRYDLAAIINDLVAARVIYPSSKKSTYETAGKFLESPDYSLADVYRSLNVLSENRYLIERELYRNSAALFEKNTSVLYYDCTNFFFETEEEDGFRMYGKCKENRPNPIVQYGLFMDSDGIPLADYVFPGNQNEQKSLKELEARVEKDFEVSRFIVCADAGLNGWENKVYNDMKRNGAYIVTQPIRKMTRTMREWAISPDGWELEGCPDTFSLKDLEGKDFIDIGGKKRRIRDLVFCKHRWEKRTKKSQSSGGTYTLEENYIITYSRKFADYQDHIREKKLERARKLLGNPGKLTKTNQRDPRYYITEMSMTGDGEVASEKLYEIDEKKIAEEKKYDGFYAVTTDLEDSDLSLIIRSNKQRWEIEESFQIMKSELKTRPMYVSREDSINGHLLTCFMALMVYRLLEKKYLNEKYTCDEVFSTLRDLNITYLNGTNYIPSFTRTEIVDALAETFGFQPSREIITQKYLKKFQRVVNSKKSTKLK